MQKQGPPSTERGAFFSGTEKLRAASAKAGGFLSVGLEPCDDYLPQGFAPGIEGHERFLRLIIEATSGLVAAYKFNLAFFEALGPPGWDLLYRIRADVPAESFIIADAKRGDIGTTAEHYARGLYESFGADSATVNPLMGRDACEPFLAYAGKLTFLLVLTSNPGADDFLLPGGLYRDIATKAAMWNTRRNIGFVVGATRPERVAEVRALAPEVPFLVPGVGAQGGELDAAARDGVMAGSFPGLLFHITRGVLPSKDEPGDAGDLIRAKTLAWRDRINTAVEQAAKPRSTPHVGV